MVAIVSEDKREAALALGAGTVIPRGADLAESIGAEEVDVVVHLPHLLTLNLDDYGTQKEITAP